MSFEGNLASQPSEESHAAVNRRANPGDEVAMWKFQLNDGPHKVVFEHGTTSGKRVILVDGVEVYRKNWMFRLVGSEAFHIGKKNKVAEITISSKGMSFEYTLTVDGKPLEKFVRAQAKNTRTWLPKINGTDHRVVLDIGTMDIYVNGEKVETIGEFADSGTETHFSVGGYSAFIRAVSSGNKMKGLLYSLKVEGAAELEPVQDIFNFNQ